MRRRLHRHRTLTESIKSPAAIEGARATDRLTGMHHLSSVPVSQRYHSYLGLRACVGLGQRVASLRCSLAAFPPDPERNSARVRVGVLLSCATRVVRFAIAIAKAGRNQAFSSTCHIE